MALVAINNNGASPLRHKPGRAIMSRSKKGGKPPGYDFWSRRPKSPENSKGSTHRAERAEGKAQSEEGLATADLELGGIGVPDFDSCPCGGACGRSQAQPSSTKGRGCAEAAAPKSEIEELRAERDDYKLAFEAMFADYQDLGRESHEEAAKLEVDRDNALARVRALEAQARVQDKVVAAEIGMFGAEVAKLRAALKRIASASGRLAIGDCRKWAAEALKEEEG
jgi:hypothetical protein